MEEMSKPKSMPPSIWLVNTQLIATWNRTKGSKAADGIGVVDGRHFEPVTTLTTSELLPIVGDDELKLEKFNQEKQKKSEDPASKYTRGRLLTAGSSPSDF